MRILIVEDDLVLSGLLRDYLQQLGHERVDACLRGRDALSAVENNVYDCAFVDVRLPDTDGLKLLPTIKGQDPSLPVVMMSGYTTMSYTIEAMRKGASDFLPKPFTLQDMAVALERVTKERNLLLENLSLKLESQARKQLELVNRKLEEKIQEQARLFEISSEIDEVRSSEELYPRIVQLAVRLTDSNKVGFFIIPPDQLSLILISHHGLGVQGPGYYPVHDSAAYFRDVLNSHSGCFSVSADKLFNHEQSGSADLDSAEFSCWSLRIRGEPFGFLASACGERPSGSSAAETKLLDFLVKKSALAIENMALYESMTSNFYGILKSLVNALEAKDLYTGKHSERVTRYALAIARQLQCSEEELEALQTVGYLHDIGKIGVADSILNKPSSLTWEEFEIVKRHPVIGETIVSELGLSPHERAIIRHHHERWDGKGYPDGLAANDIPMLARIVMVADAFDAMTSKRAYRHAMSISDAMLELVNNRRKQFDSDVVDAFREAHKNMKEKE